MEKKYLLKFNKNIYDKNAIGMAIKEFSWVSETDIILRNTSRYYDVEFPIVDDVADIVNEFKNYVLFLSIK